MSVTNMDGVIADPSAGEDKSAGISSVACKRSATGSPVSVERYKAPPVCSDASLKGTAMSTAELSAIAFAFEEVPKSSLDVVPTSGVPDAVPVSSSSSTCTRESDASDAETGLHHHHHHLNKAGQVRLDHDVSVRLNAKVALQKTSRQGRSHQRWITEANETIRLVTGCVPILRGGKILFVSSSRKAEWILPKGGWEQDEEMEESAVRESFEEAGVLGVLGPRLSDNQHETRKAKKRREELEELAKLKKFKSDNNNMESEPPAEQEVVPAGAAAPTEETVPTALVSLSDEVMKRIRVQGQANAPKTSSDETLSVASNTSGAYSQVRMTLFPLYVGTVLNKWPEDGRSRKAVDIDEAIAMMSGRPEFQKALIEVKERGLHLPSLPRNATRTTTTTASAAAAAAAGAK